MNEGIEKGKEGKRSSVENKTYVVGFGRGLSRADGSIVDVGGEEEGAMGRA